MDGHVTAAMASTTRARSRPTPPQALISAFASRGVGRGDTLGHSHAGSMQLVVFAREPVDLGEQLGPRKGLLEEVVGTDALGVILLGGLQVAAHHDDRDVL